MGLFSKLFKKKVELTEEELMYNKMMKIREEVMAKFNSDTTGTEPIEEQLNNDLTEEELKWNKMWALWAEDKLEEPISSLLTYDAEIQNGGHLQFFCNLEEREASELKEALKNLKKILPEELYVNLDKAYQEYKKLNFNPQTSEEYCEVEIEEPLLEYDDFYYENEETIQNILKEYSLKIEL